MVRSDRSDVQRVLAANLRRLRIARHLSLSELARAAEMSKATLSAVESGCSNPTVDTLATLATALHVPLTELLEEAGTDDIRVVRGRAAPTGPPPRDGIGRRALDAFAPAGGLTVTELALAPGVANERTPEASGTRAHLYVAHGRLLAGPVERVTELTVGDYASFPADVPHVLETARHAARVLLLVTVG